MKKLLLLSIILFSLTQTSKASHTFGGEIGWTCLANGKYVFYMHFYRDCTGIPWTYEEETIEIFGNPTPRGADGNPFNTILMRPDSAKWIQSNFGDISPSCNAGNGGTQFSCANRDQGTVQQFFYRSDPITLAGVPSRSGWRFFWEGSCCRPTNIENVISTGPLTLRAEIFRTKDADNADPCIDSSPKFIDVPAFVFCRGEEVSYSNLAIDSDLDSLVYSWDRPYNAPGDAPVALVYRTGYSPDNPTPDSSFDSRNIPSTLNSTNGLVRMAVYNSGLTKLFYTVVQVDSYRDGVKISSVYREIPISVIDCDFEMQNGKENTSPVTIINGDTTLEYTYSATAGQQIKIPIEVIDTDFWDSLNTQQQVISLQPEGLMFSRDRATPDPCQFSFGAGQNLGLEPCAYLQNQAPSFDTSITPPAYKLIDTGSIQTEFVWQTDCRDLQFKTGPAGTNQSVFSFVFNVQDDACPIPRSIAPTLTVRLKDPIPLTEPNMKGIDVDLNGDLTYQWVPPIDSAFSFEKYIVETGQAIDGTPMPAQNWNILNGNLRDYQQEKKNPFYQIHRNIIPVDPSSPKNILQKIPNRDWYMRMTSVSGCTNDFESDKSEQVRVMELDVSPAANFPFSARSEVRLNWNRAKPLEAQSKNYFQYESPTRFYIWQCDSLNYPAIRDSLNWYLRDSTYETTISLSSNSCSNYAAFRIQARDTVVTWKQGNGPGAGLDSLDTLTFSTYSVIDTLFMIYSKPKVQRIGAQVLNSNYPADTYQWIDCNTDTLLTNETSRELQLSDTGRYAVITSNGSCIDTSDCFIVESNLNSLIVKTGRKTLKSLDSLANYQWFDCEDNSLIQGANSQIYEATDTGKFGVIVSVFSFSERSNCLEISLNLNDSIVLIGKDTLQSLDTLATYQWYNCGKESIIPGATEQSFVMQDTGYYAVIVSDFGYSDTSSCYAYFPIGLKEQAFKKSISLFPNPTTGDFKIVLSENYEIISVRLFNLQGQLIMEQQLKGQNSIDLNIAGKPGIYFIQLTNEKGEQANLKVVKQ